jgi:hypothetical protein
VPRFVPKACPMPRDGGMTLAGFLIAGPVAHCNGARHMIPGDHQLEMWEEIKIVLAHKSR